ncbi:hypothetical protein [Paraburkholderia sp. GAS82]|uniref:hypothetical protein n=1 Tax=Paraburkholderia sp. GAS82 TaxID=3035137 RepID=UPI003D1B1C1E
MDETADTTNLGSENPDNPELDEGSTATPETPETDDAASGAQTTTPETGSEGAPTEGAGEDEFEFQFGDEAPPASGSQEDAAAPQWVKDLRKQNTEDRRRIRELEAQLQQKQPQAPAVPTLGAKPKLENFDYDEGKYDEALSKWYEDKRKVDAAQDDQRKAEEARQRERDERLVTYKTEASSLKRKDFQEVESDVIAALTPDQQGILLLGADKPAAFIYTLGRYPTKLRELAAIKNPVRFAFAAAKLEKDLKVTSRNTNAKPAPEGRVESSSGAPAVGGGEKKLEQLRAEAERTGDYSKVHSYKRQLKQAQSRR